MLEWLQQWYKEQCDGEWEHEYTIRITTIDNPGWSVEIDLAFTKLEDLQIAYSVDEKSETDWIGFSVENKIFKGSGSSDKLNSIIERFKELWESN